MKRFLGYFAAIILGIIFITGLSIAFVIASVLCLFRKEGEYYGEIYD